MTNNNADVKVSLKDKLKEAWDSFVEDWKDPVKRKVRNKNLLIRAGKLIRELILIGLCFIILLPIFEKLSAALRHPSDISDPQVVFIPDQFSLVNFQIA